MSRRTRRPYKVYGAGELATHSATRYLAPEMNGPVVQQKFTFLLRDACGCGPSETAGAVASDDHRAFAGVSRRRSHKQITSTMGYLHLTHQTSLDALRLMDDLCRGLPR